MRILGFPKHAPVWAIATVLIASAATTAISALHGGAARPGVAWGAGPGDQPYWSQTAAYFRDHGHKGLGDRAPELQGIMQRMYASDSSYTSLSATFVDHTPGSMPGSINIEIQQPDSVYTTAFNNDSATGTPDEITSGQGFGLTVYSPAANVYTTVAQNHVDLPPLGSVPISVVPQIQSMTTIVGYVAGPRAWEADMFIHPAKFVTSAIFAEKDITVQANVIYEGRKAWMLDGQLDPAVDVTAHHNPLGDEWRAWIDQQTGLILRLQYYHKSSLAGWAELRKVVIDGNGVTFGWTLPANAVGVPTTGDYAQATHRLSS